MISRRLPELLLAGIAATAAGCAAQPPVSAEVQAQVQKLRSGNPRVRVEAVQALCQMTGDERAARILVARMQDRESYETGLDSLGHMMSTSPGSEAEFCLDSFGAVATPALLEAVKDRNPEQRERAIYILSMTEDPLGIEPTIEAMLNDPSERVRSTAAQQLAPDDPRALQPLIQALKDETVSEHAAAALAHIRNPATIEPFIDALLHSKDWPTRGHAASALGAFGGERAVEPLLAATKDPHEWVRIAAVEALGATRDPRVSGPLLAMLEGDDLPVAFNAAAALGKLREKRAVEPLIRILQSYDPSQRSSPGYMQRSLLREHAATALGKIGDFRATPVLVKALHDPEINLPGIAALALGELGDPAAIEPLTAAMDTPVSLNKERMSKALDRLSDRSASPSPP